MSLSYLARFTPINVPKWTFISYASIVISLVVWWIQTFFQFFRQRSEVHLSTIRGKLFRWLKGLILTSAVGIVKFVSWN